MPASSAILASRRLSGQVPDQRSGTLVTARPEEQLVPNSPIFSAWPPASRLRCGNVICIRHDYPSGLLQAAPAHYRTRSVLGDAYKINHREERHGGVVPDRPVASPLESGARPSPAAVQARLVRHVSAWWSPACGGPTDVIARIVRDRSLPRAVRPCRSPSRTCRGAGGNTGTAQAAKAPTDGYTLLVDLRTGFMRQPEPLRPRALRSRSRMFAPDARRPRRRRTCRWSIPTCRRNRCNDLVSADRMHNPASTATPSRARLDAASRRRAVQMTFENRSGMVRSQALQGQHPASGDDHRRARRRNSRSPRCRRLSTARKNGKVRALRRDGRAQRATRCRTCRP